jgi:hypothetical protein
MKKTALKQQHNQFTKSNRFKTQNPPSSESNVMSPKNKVKESLKCIIDNKELRLKEHFKPVSSSN